MRFVFTGSSPGATRDFYIYNGENYRKVAKQILSIALVIINLILAKAVHFFYEKVMTFHIQL